MTFQEALIAVADSNGRLGARCKEIPQLGTIRWSFMGWTLGGFNQRATLPGPEIIKLDWETVETEKDRL